MNYILFDGTSRNALLPFTYTRPVAEIRVGVLTIREKWEKYLGYTTTTVTEDYLSDKYPMVEFDVNIMINASYLPNQELVDKIINLKENQIILDGDVPVAFHIAKGQEVDFDTYQKIPIESRNQRRVQNTYDIFSNNPAEIVNDVELITKDRISHPLDPNNQAIGVEKIFIEEGAKVNLALLNATEGPIYIGKNAEIMEGCMIRGPFALCDNATLKMGAKIYGGTTVGPHSKVGGEVSNSVIFGYSNKGHDGFLGNSVVGEWCNLGADTNTSNLKNNYAAVRLWNYETKRFVDTGLQFCGLMMGDHSKCGINTMFNTGTVVGVNANIFGGGFPRNFIPSYSWGGSGGFTTYLTRKAFEVAKMVMSRRKLEFTEVDQKILQHVFEETHEWRKSYS